MWRALIAIHLDRPLPAFQHSWRKEWCPVRVCWHELDLHGHHCAACSASVGGERTHHHNDVVDYVAGQLKRAGFPCTSKDSDIPQHPSPQIGGAQYERGDYTFQVSQAACLVARPSLILCALILTTGMALSLPPAVNLDSQQPLLTLSRLSIASISGHTAGWASFLANSGRNCASFSQFQLNCTQRSSAQRPSGAPLRR